MPISIGVSWMSNFRSLDSEGRRRGSPRSWLHCNDQDKGRRCAELVLTQSCQTLFVMPGSTSSWDSPGKSTGMGCHSFLQGISRDQTPVSCIAGGFFTIWATREASNFARSWLCCNRMYMCVSCSVVSNSLRTHGLEPTRFLCPWDFPGKNTGVGFHSLLQGIFPTQGSNLGLVHCRQILYHLSHQGSQDKDPDMALWETQAGVMVL